MARERVLRPTVSSAMKSVDEMRMRMRRVWRVSVRVCMLEYVCLLMVSREDDGFGGSWYRSFEDAHGWMDGEKVFLEVEMENDQETLWTSE